MLNALDVTTFGKNCVTFTSDDGYYTNTLSDQIQKICILNTFILLNDQTHTNTQPYQSQPKTLK